MRIIKLLVNCFVEGVTGRFALLYFEGVIFNFK